MVVQLEQTTEPEIIYPDQDGNLMSDNTKQFWWIMFIFLNLEYLFSGDENVFIAADLLWYPVERRNDIRQAPDIMVAFGRPKGYRGSYRQWNEDNIPPQVVFEILSPGNTTSEMSGKLIFYLDYGVEEYYLYDPDTNNLKGWIRNQGTFSPIKSMNNWISPRLGIRFDLSGEELQLFLPNGQPFTTFNQEKYRAESERLRAEQEKARAESAILRAEKLAQKLRELGIDTD